MISLSYLHCWLFQFSFILFIYLLFFPEWEDIDSYKVHCICHFTGLYDLVLTLNLFICSCLLGAFAIFFACMLFIVGSKWILKLYYMYASFPSNGLIIFLYNIEWLVCIIFLCLHKGCMNFSGACGLLEILVFLFFFLTYRRWHRP